MGTAPSATGPQAVLERRADDGAASRPGRGERRAGRIDRRRAPSRRGREVGRRLAAGAESGVNSMLEVSNAVATIVLDRPERGNALSAEFVEAMLAAVQRACADVSAHTLVLRAQG